MYDELDDEVLISKIIRQDAKAFTVLVHRHTPFYFKIAYQFLWNSSYANDILQEAFAVLWLQPEKFKKQKNAKFTTWFYTVVSNLCKNNNRKEKAMQKKSLAQYKSNCLNDSRQDNTQKLKLMRMSLLSLQEKQQQALILYYYKDLPQKEAAEIMGLTLKAFESLVFRGKATLKKLIEKQTKREVRNGIEKIQRFA